MSTLNNLQGPANILGIEKARLASFSALALSKKSNLKQSMP